MKRRVRKNKSILIIFGILLGLILAGVLTTCSMFDQIDWKIALSSSVIAGLASILTNIAGLPEIELEEKLNLNKN